MNLPDFLGVLDERRASYRLDRVRDAVMVIVTTPGQRWEVEFLDGGDIEIERFTSDGRIADQRAIRDLLAEL